jgi:hypothetical protein
MVVMGRVTKGRAGDLRSQPAHADTSRRNATPVRWGWIGIGPDDQTLRIEFLEGMAQRLHHVEIDEGDANIQVTVFVGMDVDAPDGAYAAVGFPRWVTATTDRPVGDRRISDGSAIG